MKIIGLTGSIAMGKSTTASMLRRLNIPVFDSDREVHLLLARSPVLKAQIGTYFPECIDSKTGNLDRQKLGQTVFSSPSQRRFLESLIHPYIWRAQNRFVHKARRMGQKTVILDIPLLFETGREKVCDHILCVSAPSFLQKQRVFARPGMTEGKFAAILRGQWPSRHKEIGADHVIKTGQGFAATRQKLVKALNRLKNKEKGHAA